MTPPAAVTNHNRYNTTLPLLRTVLAAVTIMTNSNPVGDHGIPQLGGCTWRRLCPSQVPLALV